MIEETLDLHAVIELFGHTRIAGRVREQTVGSSTFLRIDVPGTKHQPAFTRIVNPSAVYAINPVTEEVAVAMARSINVEPINNWDARRVLELIRKNNDDSLPIV